MYNIRTYSHDFSAYVHIAMCNSVYKYLVSCGHAYSKEYFVLDVFNEEFKDSLCMYIRIVHHLKWTLDKKDVNLYGHIIIYIEGSAC